jgi:hypothetical protein
VTLRALAVVSILVGALRVTTARADDASAQQSFETALARAAAGDARAIDDLEALGAARPATRWTDDAWEAAAQLAERARDFDRGRRDWEQALSTADNDQMRRRARAALDRLAATTGASGQWSAAAAEHERLLAQLAASGDPKPALAALEAFARARAGYPRAVDVRIAIARGWERDGDAARAIEWLRDAARIAATPADIQHARVALFRTLARAGELDDAEAERDALAATAGVDRAIVRLVDDELAAARRHAWLRRALWLALGAIAVAAVVALRRDARSWRAAARRLARPPVEVWFLAPVAVVLVAIAQTGNPMVASAVRAIAAVGVGVAWLSGAVLDGARARGRVGLARASVHAVLAAIAVVAAAYLAVDRGQMIGLIVETIREGPAMR